MRNLLLLPAVTLAIAATSAPQATPVDPDPRPNVVVIFFDDLGYGDLGCYGSPTNTTPNIDRLAREGMRFTDFYVSQPVCSASRASLLTGCYANRIGIHQALGPKAKVGLHDEETTLAELLKAQGYATAVFGKWHLGHRTPFLPTRHGFDEYFGIPYSNDMWPFHPQVPKSYPKLPLFEGDRIVDAEVTPDDQRTLTRRITERAVAFVREQRDNPFFLYVPHPQPHVPLFAGERFDGKTGRGLYADVLAELDWSVGEIVRAVDEVGAAERTLVIVTSDNGPWLSYGAHAGSAGPLREGKGTCHEGGVRVPMIARWPGRIEPASVCRRAAMTIDVLPTVASLVGAENPPGIDGVDISRLLFDDPAGPPVHESLLFYYHKNHLEAVRAGRWKLHVPHRYRTMRPGPRRTDGIPGKYDYKARQPLALYDLLLDVGETTDVAADHPDVMKRMLAIVERARIDLGDALVKREGRGVRPPGRLDD